MKRVQFLIATIAIMIASTFVVSAQSGVDTIINKGDGKVVIIDQRPRTIINRPNAPKPVDPVVIKEQPVVNNYYPIERVIEVQQSKDYTAYWLVPLLLIILIVGAIIWLANRGSHCNCGCHQQHCNHPPVINHFHVAGGNSIIDTSENLSNFQPVTEYHRHNYMAAAFAGHSRASETATGAKDTEVKS